jgi:tripeptide aminopeptidase
MLQNNDLIDLILPRFLRYVTFWTTSDLHKTDTPSTLGQWELAKCLVQELQALGLTDISLTDHCYVIARVPATVGKEQAPVIGLMAHLDTSAEVSGKEVQPALVKQYDGKVINGIEGVLLDPALDPELSALTGTAIIHTDGTTLLGADDKAGIAEIMGALEYYLAHPEQEHGPLEIIFTPDEETGKGLAEFPYDSITATACYTVDGGSAGELEAECFNAYQASVQFSGNVTHLGTARGVLVNASVMAATFAAMLPRSESPEATDGYYGYYCMMEIAGNLEHASLEVYIRDFDAAAAERRVAALYSFAQATEAQFPGGHVTVAATKQYRNMKEKIAQHPVVLDTLKQAFVYAGVKYKVQPIRGGTDGSRLTEMGIPTPNIFTGGHNFHSRNEWASVTEMAAACRVIIELIRLWGAQS